MPYVTQLPWLVSAGSKKLAPSLSAGSFGRQK